MSTPESTQTSLQATSQPRSLQGLIEASAKELARALPDHMRPERLVRIALTCIRQNPDLAKVTQESFLGSLFTSAQMGIEPIGGLAWLLPFNNSRKKPDGTWHTVKECQFILGYKGVVSLFYRHEKAISLSWGVRKSNDTWEMILGTNERLTHIPADVERGEVVGYWVKAKLANGGQPFHYMTRVECLEHGKKHSKTYNKKSETWFDSSPWVKDEEAMCLKTVLVQGAKLWPISVELLRSLDADETTRTINPAVEDILDIPSETNWKEVEEKVKSDTTEKMEQIEKTEKETA